ncbi:MAG TPA: GAF domain-containing protein [Thermoanaerobaculia bacterium]
MTENQTVHSRLRAISAIIAEGLPRAAVFTRIVDGIALLGFDRVRLDLLSVDGAFVEPVACRGGGCDGGRIPVAADPDLPRFRRKTHPQIFTEPHTRGCVPVLLRGKPVGKISVDNETSRRPLDPKELDEIVPFANQAALAHALLSDERRSWAESLENLQQTTLAITSVRDRNELLEAIVEQSVRLLNAKSGGLYEYRPDQGELTIIADYNREESLLGSTLKIGEGMAGKLVASGQRFMTEPDYNAWEGRAEVFGGSRKFGAVLEVPLVWEGNVIGVLYVDDEAGRTFSETEARLLGLFADQAAICLTQTALFAKDAQKLQRLERLARVTQEMMGNLDVMSWRKRLDMIARSAAEVLEAETTGVFRVREGHLVLEAGHGQREELEPGTVKLRIHNEDHGGLTGWIAYHGELFNQHGEILKSHRAVAVGSTPHAPSGGCYSLLAIPLKRKVGEKEEVIGLIRADNKQIQGGQGPVPFNQEDERILTIFAEAAVIAIESAELVNRLKEQREFQERLISSSPDGIISVDRQGLVTEFNQRAEEVLGYTREEVLGRPVSRLYFEEEEPRRIGRMLHESPEHEVSGYETAVRSKAGERIPIRHASTWLFNAEGERVGSVGYFEDLREQKALERRESLLLHAGNVVAREEILDKGLQRLSEMMVELLGRSFCCILIMEEDGDYLVLRAASRSGDPEWNPGRQRIDPVAWSGLPKLLKDGIPTTREWSNPKARPSLEKLADALGLGPGEEIRSLLIVPLKIGERVVGQLDLGDLREDAKTAFSSHEIGLVSAIAAQITVLVDRMELLEKRTRKEKLFKALVNSSVYIRGEMEMGSLLQGIVGQAAELVECKVGGLFLHRSYIGQLELAAVYGLPEGLLGQTLSSAGGLLGQAARQGETGVHTGPPDFELFRSVSLRTIAAVALKGSAGEVEAVLFVGDPEAEVRFGRTDREVLEDFATQAAIALRTSRLMGQEQRFFSQLAILHRISDYIQAADQLERILLTVLTGVTASFGLGFNRAMLMLLDETGEQLVGEMGIGELEEHEARAGWKGDQAKGAKDFEHFRRRLEAGEIVPTTTTVGRKIRGLCIPAQGDHLFAEVLASQTFRRIGIEELEKVPREFLDTFNVTTPLAVVPLRAKEQVIGILAVDNKFNQAPISDDACNQLMTFAATAAVAIDNRRLFDQTRSAANKLLDFYKLSQELITLQEPREILRKVVEQTKVAAGASWVSVILIDEAGRAFSPIKTGHRFSLEPMDSLPIRRQGISMEVMRTGEAFRIENVDKMRHRINRDLMSRSVRAAICLPLSLPGKRIGVMWIHYDEPRRFPDSEVAALQLYVNQAAIAHDSARRLTRLEDLREFSNILAEADDMGGVLQQIVDGARQVLKADTAVLLLYDEPAESFIPEVSVHAGDHLAAWGEFQRKSPRPQGTALKVLAKGWLLVDDVQALGEEEVLGPNTREFVDAVRGRGFLGVTLKTGRERLGVLYAIYTKPFQFDDQEEETTLAFANRAALFLKKSKLVQQLQRARKTAEVVTRLTLLEDQKASLQSIVQEIREALECGAVVLFKYDQESGNLILPPAMAGVAQPIDPIEDQTLVLAMTELDTPYIVPDVNRDDRFRESPFTKHQGIKSCVAIPLKAADRKVGVMFVNYRNPRRFTPDDVSAMELFANQAAVAVRNMQLFDELGSKLAEQETLAGLSKKLLGASSVQETMDRAVEYAARTLDTELSNIVLPDREGRLRFSAAVGWDQEMVGKFVLEPGEGQTGYTIQQRKPVAAYDFSKETRFKVPAVVFEYNLQSGLSAPMFRGGEIVGAMLVHTRKPRRFNEDDGLLLSLIANQTAIALERAQQFEASQRKSSYLAALYEVSKAITAQFSLERRQIMEQIIQPAMEKIVGLQGPRATLGTIQLYDETSDELVLESVYPPESYQLLVERLGERRPLRSRIARGEKVGISGRTVIDGVPQLVPDVRKNDEYIEFSPANLSELAVPLIDRDLGKVIGVLNVESDQTYAFDKEDQEALQTLAELAVIAIQNSRRFEALRTQTTLAWMGLGNAVGRHELEGQIGLVLGKLHLLERALDADNPSPGRAEELLADIERRLRRFSLDRPAGQANEELSSILVNEELIDAFHHRFLESHRGWRQMFTTQCDLDPKVRIRANLDWLSRVLDILVNNAAQAAARNIILGSRPGQEELWVEIYVADDGKGIPEPVRDRLLREPIREGSKGLGTGLLIAQEVVRSYGGSIRFEDRKPQGTVMVISLPMEIQGGPPEADTGRPE